MTEKKIGKLKRTLVFLLAAVMSVSLLFAVACGTSSTDDTDDDTTYTKVENDTQLLKNGNFEFGTADVDLDDYPYTSVTGWSKATDNSASSSNVNSGIISTADDAWDELISTLSENETFLKSLGKEKADKDDEDAHTTLKDELKAAFANPGTHDGAEGSKVYMLNNYYKDNIGKGTAQKLTASTAFTLEPNTYGEISVWVKTANLKGSTGANIRIITTVAGITQDEYAIENIAESVWTKYTVYVRSNEYAETTVKLVVGLGYGQGASDFTGDYVEGTVYIDDAAYTEIESASGTYIPATLKVESSSERKVFEATTDNKYYVSFTCPAKMLSTPNGEDRLNLGVQETTSNTGVSNVPSNSSFDSTKSISGFEVTQVNNSTTAKFSSNNFKVEHGKYALITFTLSMNVNKLQKNGLSVWLIDTYNDETNEQQVLDNVTVEDDTLYSIVVNNNFADGDAREFYLVFIFGPTDVYTTEDQTEYVTGSYEVKNFTYNTFEIDEKDESIAYKIMENASTLNSFALYAGFDSDYSETEESESYSFTVAHSDEGSITHTTARVSGYKGITDYGTSESKNKNVVSGLINSKHFDTYDNDIKEAVKTALNYTGKGNIQPLMIWNKEATSYGYVKNEALTLSENSTATLSVKVKVNAGATAYIYLIDTTRGDGYLEPISQKFSVNDKEYNNDLVIKVGDTNGEWVTVKFYVASGKDAINYRLEMWNGERYKNGATVANSTGFVFFDEVTTGSSFTVADVISSANKGEIEGFEYINQDMKEVKYTQVLNDKEIKWNKENKDDTISYTESTVWATDVKERLLLVSFATINPTENDPYASTDDDTEDTTDKTGCADVDASALALSISSLVLAVALVAAIVAVIVKAILRKTKRNKKDAKSHYKVTSRNKTNKAIKAKNDAKLNEAEEDLEEIDEPEETPVEEYTYGEVLEDFGDEETATQQTQEDSETEETNEDK